MMTFRWVMYLEQRICNVDNKLVIHHETMKKLKRKLEIIQQMASAPELYCKAVVEVVRRKNFTYQFQEVKASTRHMYTYECNLIRLSQVFNSMHFIFHSVGSQSS